MRQDTGLLVGRVPAGEEPGGDRGEGHIRLTYACPDEVLEEGLDRIRQGVENL